MESEKIESEKIESEKIELVSVVMPVYNGEDYIEETIKCVVDQTYRTIELIIVDDGSTDNTAEIVKSLMNDDSRIKYYYREKGNAGVQRNYGFEQSKGEFLLFLDSDDLFERDMIEKMINKIIIDKADICVCNADQYNTENGEYVSKPQYLRMKAIPEEIPFSRKSIGNKILYFTTSVPWNKLIKREFIENNNLRFQDIERANDQLFSIMALVMAESITIVEDVLVHYRVKQKGNLTTDFSQTPLCAFWSMLESSKCLSEKGLLDDENVRCALDNKIANLMIYSLNIQKDIAGYKELYELLHNGGFEKLGFILKDKEYYFDPLEFENIKKIMLMSYDEFLLTKNREYRDVIAKKNQTYKNMLSQKNEKIAELKEKEKELNAIKRKNWYKKITKLIAQYHRVIGKED